MEELSKYEQQRLEHIRRNQEFLVSMGLADAKAELASATKKTPAPPQKRTKVQVPESLRRRSNRKRCIEPDYTGEKIDQFGDTIDTAISSRSSVKRKAAAALLEGADSEEDDEEQDYDAMMDEMRSASMAWLAEAREQLLALATIQDVEAAGQEEWRAEAIQRWGEDAGKVPGGKRDWKLFVESRLSTPPPVSPIDFLQEYYAADSWRLLCSCILMSRVSSWDTKHNCISAFFERYPTPSALLQEDKWHRVREVINPLGLFDDRLKSLTSLTTHFFAHDNFEISLERNSPHKVLFLHLFVNQPVVIAAGAWHWAIWV